MNYRGKTMLTILIITLFSGGILGYTYYRTKDLVAGPQIVIESPINGATLDKALIKIKGFARNISTITLNDRKIFIDESGAISEEILLTYGYNIITLTAEDRFNRKITKTLELIYK